MTAFQAPLTPLKLFSNISIGASVILFLGYILARRSGVGAIGNAFVLFLLTMSISAAVFEPAYVMSLCWMNPNMKDTFEEAKMTPQQKQSLSANIEAVEAQVQKPIVDKENAFGFAFFKELTKASKNENTLVGPAPLSSCLSIVYRGARQPVNDKLTEMLGFGSVTPQQLDEHDRAIKELLNHKVPGLLISSPVILAVDDTVSIEQSYKQSIESIYDARLLKGSMQILQPQLDQWVRSSTNGKISKAPEVQGNTKAQLLMTSYFDGKWLDEFKEEKTKPNEFFTADGSKTQVQMMHQTQDYTYAEDSLLQAVDLPYRDERHMMTVLLPAKSSSLSDLIENLDGRSWNELREKMSSRPGTIGLPKFRHEGLVELLPAIKKTGLGILEEPPVFSKLDCTGGLLYISAIKQQGGIDVNEKGTVVWMVTSLSVAAGAAGGPEPKPFKMIVDRPFLVVISNKDTGQILFILSMFDPNSR